ncbi:acyl-CoA dehydrogenase family protein [Gramella sp. AN32]|uniref:Acyl-CoA dehydrogenase family protein n=1 Tax=Christiangramia antarctica TaxID=2058158 RepID=A0ABW5XCU8_9FLAO|nr:acyl-CoA dehydrogenase family protein [Gramella sp. AN32]MCM4157335.1 acyl-CoA dehydrogenase [Gramella sp. AN32]
MNFNPVPTQTAYTRFIPKKYTSGDENYPKKFMEKLQSTPLMVLNVPIEYGGEGLGINGGTSKILRVLQKLGAYDLSVGRIYEGHINALSLINQFGTEAQKRDYFSQAKNGTFFGIWNSEIPAEALQINKTKEGYTLKGAKIFCSGANHILRPIVTADGEDGKLMLVLNLDEYGLTEDYAYWKPMGMSASVSCRFDFSEITITEDQILGKPSAYFANPEFVGGAIRFAAVQLGGARAAFQATLDHLVEYKRTDDVLQLTRIGKIKVLMETGNLWLKKAGKAFDKREKFPEECMDIANSFRILTREICEKTLALCEMSVGLQGLLKPHPLERIHRDLSVYLKQPAPDHTLLNIGKRQIELFQNGK